MKLDPQPLVISETVHQQLAYICRNSIRDGSYKPGDKFPSERQLAEYYKISRVTANKVIAKMVAEGLLIFRPGIGTFVREREDRLHTSLREMQSFTQHAFRMGWQPSTQILAFKKTTVQELAPSPQTALITEQHSPETPLIYVKRLRLADSIPVILEHRWMISEFVPGITQEELSGSLYDLLEKKYQIIPTGEQLRIRARCLTREESDLLLDTENAPVLDVSGIGLNQETQPIWYQNLLYRADRYELMNTVHNFGPGCQSNTSLQPQQPNKKNE